MNQWIPITERKPTEADADDRGFVYVTNLVGWVSRRHWKDLQLYENLLAWHPKQKTPSPYIPVSQSQYRPAVMPDDYGALAEFSSAADFSHFDTGLICGYVEMTEDGDTIWMDDKGGHYSFCRIPSCDEEPSEELLEYGRTSTMRLLDEARKRESSPVPATVEEDPYAVKFEWTESRSRIRDAVLKYAADCDASINEESSPSQPKPVASAPVEAGSQRRAPTKEDLKNGPIKAWFRRTLGDQWMIGTLADIREPCFIMREDYYGRFQYCEIEVTTPVEVPAEQEARA